MTDNTVPTTRPHRYRFHAARVSILAMSVDVGGIGVEDHKPHTGADIVAAHIDPSTTMQGTLAEMVAVIDELHAQLHAIADARDLQAHVDSTLAGAELTASNVPVAE
jgi:hypothetical protein